MKVYVLIEYCCNHFIDIHTDKNKLMQLHGFANENELDESEYAIQEFELEEM
jgi:hypothetical protein